MSDEQKSGDEIYADISQVSGSQITVGKGNVQQQFTGSTAPEITEAGLADLWQKLADLQARVEAEAPAENKDAALKRVKELEAAVMSTEPNLTTMEYVRDWFGRNLPALAGAVTSVVLHPIVGKLVEAASEALAAEFHRRFGQL